MWSYPQAGAQHSNSSSKLNEFFNDQDAATALIREAIQNAMDAVLSPKSPVRVRFTIGTVEWKILSKYLATTQQNETVNDHLKSSDLKKFAQSFEGSTQKFLIIEDQGTKGLIGTTNKDDARSGSNFVGFWWNDGISGKGKGTSGSHGVGKTTLTKISSMSLFLALTKRSDDNKKFLLGFSNLPYHRVGDKSYLGYGRYGKLSGKGNNQQFLPIDDETEINRFEKDFQISRESSGLSILIPGIPSTVELENLCLATVRDYYWPILKGELIVEIVDKLQKTSVEINSSNLVNKCIDLVDNPKVGSSKIDETINRIKLAEEILSLRESNSTNWFIGYEPRMRLEGTSTRGVFTKEDISEENLKLCTEAYDAGELVGFNFSLTLEPTDRPKTRGLVQVFFKKISHSLSENTQFIRNQIIISKQPSHISSKEVACFVVAEDQEMSDYLKEAEEPAHTKWFINRFNSQKSYKSDWALRFVSDLPSIMYKILTNEDEEGSKIKNFATDIFSVSEPSDEGKSTKKKKKKKDKTDPPSDIPKDTRVPIIRVERDDVNTGFKIVTVPRFNEILSEQNITLPIRLKVKAAYLSAFGKSRSWKDYSPIDFQFEKNIPIQIEPSAAASIISVQDNELTLEITQDKFEISVAGFDENRDLLVHPKVMLEA